MTFEQMKECLKTIKLLEKDLLRDLTAEEKEVVINEGWEKFLFDPKHLNFTDEDYKELKTLKAIISAFYTQDEEVLDKTIKDAPAGVYFVLMDIIDKFDSLKPCACPTKDECQPVKKDATEEFVKFMQDLYNSLPKKETSWFNKLNDKIRKDLFDIYRKNRNEQQDCSDEILGGILTDAVKDGVVEDLVARLKKGEEVEMTNAEYLEVADYLCRNEKQIFLSNENGKVKLTVF